MSSMRVVLDGRSARVSDAPSISVVAARRTSVPRYRRGMTDHADVRDAQKDYRPSAGRDEAITTELARRVDADERQLWDALRFDAVRSLGCENALDAGRYLEMNFGLLYDDGGKSAVELCDLAGVSPGASKHEVLSKFDWMALGEYYWAIECEARHSQAEALDSNFIYQALRGA